MQTFILPGFSLKNRDWAEDTQKKLAKHSPTLVYYWKHWETEKPEGNWIEKEAGRIVNKIGNKKANLVAKSIGTAVVMIVVKSKPANINKLILCGIPINDFLKEDENYYQILKNFPAEKVLCIQNVNDNHGSLAQAQKLLKSINSEIKIIPKPRSDHKYPYADDFIGFLK